MPFIFLHKKFHCNALENAENKNRKAILAVTERDIYELEDFNKQSDGNGESSDRSNYF